MIKTILSTVTVAAVIAFSGCSAITDNPVANAVKGATNTVTGVAKSATGAVVDGAKGAAGAVTGGSSLKDKATDKAIEAADAKTDGKASQVINAVK